MRSWVPVASALVLAGCGAAEGAQHPTLTAPHATMTAAPGTTAPAVALRPDPSASAEAAVWNFYHSISTHDYARAWSRLGPSLHRSFGGLAEWRDGYRTTLSVSATEVDALTATSENARVSLKLDAIDRDACGRRTAQRFAGEWTLVRRGNRWVAERIRMRRVRGHGPTTTATACASPSRSTPAAPHPSKRSPVRPSPSPADAVRVCYPAVHLPEVRLAAVDIPATTIPAVTLNGHHYPARHLPGRHIAGRTIPARTLPGHCYSAPRSFAPGSTTIRVSGYEDLDRDYSADLSERYWDRDSSISTPDPTAPGFGELNAAGFPKNQYVRPYVRRDGTFVSGYWRNSPSDGLPTCRVISC